jgi:Dihydrodipicolinate synthetase family
MIILEGLSAFPITPSDARGQVDVTALRRLVARLCAAKVDSIGLLGSTGTYAYLSRSERRRAMEAALDEVGGQAPILVGVGALRTDEAVRLAQDAKAAGAAAGLLAPVSYTPLTEDEVFEHFATVARESGLPLCIYDNPGTTHFRFSPALIGRLSRLPEIIAVKSPVSGAAVRCRTSRGTAQRCAGGLLARIQRGLALRRGSDRWRRHLVQRGRGSLPADQHDHRSSRSGRRRCASTSAERTLGPALEPLQDVLQPAGHLCERRSARHLPR